MTFWTGLFLVAVVNIVASQSQVETENVTAKIGEKTELDCGQKNVQWTFLAKGSPSTPCIDGCKVNVRTGKGDTVIEVNAGMLLSKLEHLCSLLCPHLPSIYTNLLQKNSGR